MQHHQKDYLPPIRGKCLSASAKAKGVVSGMLVPERFSAYLALSHKWAYGLLRRYASRKDVGEWIASSLCFSQRRGRMDCFVAVLLAKTWENGLLRRCASRKDGAGWIASSLLELFWVHRILYLRCGWCGRGLL